MKHGLVAVACVGLTACAPAVVVRDRDSACRVARDMMHRNLSTAEMVELTAPFPRANAYALRAYQAKLAALTMTGFGAAGIAGGFIAGFAFDQSNPDVRTGLYADIGVTLGLGVAVLIAGYVYGKSSHNAVAQLESDTSAECAQAPPEPEPQAPQAPPQLPLLPTQ